MAESDLVNGRLSSVGLAETPSTPPDGEETPFSVSNALQQTRSTFMGLEDLPVDEPPLDEDDETAVAGATEPETPVTPEAEPLPVAPQSNEDVALLRERLAVLESELATMRATPAAPVVPEVPPGPPTIDRVSSRIERAFEAIEALDPGANDYQSQRARLFAESIQGAMLEDMVSDPIMQQHVQRVADQIARERATEVVQQDRAAQAAEATSRAAFATAAERARARGYDVYTPDDPRHAQSQDSFLFWAVAAQVSRPGMTLDQEIAQTLDRMPARAPATPAHPATPVRQPMARQGVGPQGTPAATPTEGEYTPMNLGSMLNQSAQIRRIGAA